mmetsp:Transcript_13940/g.15389  ORF Transcript_13940/g.15389 Transcript_13940/m.15389 type:complete len:252 (-) Transcript_13940:338-1093(-)
MAEGTSRPFNRGFGGKKDKGPKREDKNPLEDWSPVTKLGRLVHARKIKSIEDIYSHALPIKEPQIIDYFFPKKDLQQEVMKIKPVQKQTKAGQRTRFKAIVVAGDCAGHVGLGAKVSTEVQLAIQGAVTAAKLSIIPIRRGYWGNKIGEVHTVPMKVTGKCGSVRVRLVPAPRGTGIVGAPASKKLLQFAGVGDCFTKSTGCTRTIENFLGATFDAIRKTYGYLTPDLWGETKYEPTPYQTWSDWLAPKAH